MGTEYKCGCKNSVKELPAGSWYLCYFHQEILNDLLQIQYRIKAEKK